MTYGYKKLKDGSMVPYPIDTQLPKNKMKLTNNDLDILVMLVEDKLKEIYNAPEGAEIYSKPEIFRKLLSKLDTMYFE
jgi:hypothetical protein